MGLIKINLKRIINKASFFKKALVNLRKISVVKEQ